ncbi:MAG: hypothetical protein AMXMBFR6_13550 [Betaproteobacteria bacterium]
MQRRGFLKALAGAALVGPELYPAASGARETSGNAPVRIGLMLPYTGAYAQLGTNITNGFRLAMAERGQRLAGRGVEILTLDDESNPAKAPENAHRLVSRDKVDVLVGSVHSGVALGMARVVRETGTPWINPNAGAAEITGSLCAANVFRTSFSNWQTIYPLGQVLRARGHRSAVFLTWRYVAGEEAAAAFREGFEQAGGKVVKELYLPFPQTDFQALLTEIAALKPDAVGTFISGAGAIKFLKDYAAAGLRGRIPLYGSGFLTDGILDEVGDVAEGIETTLHYGDGIENKKNQAFRLAYAKTFKLQPDVYAVQGYDAGQLLALGVEAVQGAVGRRAELLSAMAKAKIDSPRGRLVFSSAHNPIQDIYLRKVVGRENRVIGVAHKALADPGRGCKMA